MIGIKSQRGKQQARTVDWFASQINNADIRFSNIWRPRDRTLFRVLPSSILIPFRKKLWRHHDVHAYTADEKNTSSAHSQYIWPNLVESQIYWVQCYWNILVIVSWKAVQDNFGPDISGSWVYTLVTTWSQLTCMRFI